MAEQIEPLDDDDEDDMQYPTPCAAKLKYGDVTLSDSDIQHVCNTITEGLDEDEIRAIYPSIESAEDLLRLVQTVSQAHGDLVMDGVRALAASRERGDATLQ